MSEQVVILSAREFQQKLNYESQRAMRYNRQFCVLVFHLFDNRPATAKRAHKIILENVRLVDAVSYEGGNQVTFLFPEIGDTAIVPANRLLGIFIENGIQVSGGYAIYPGNGTITEALLNDARRVAEQTEPGKIKQVETDAQVLELGGARVVVQSAATKRLFGLTENLAKSTLPVLIQGETGVGKELVAIALHAWSNRSAGPWVSINCAAMPESLLESELFGHVKGSFSGAHADKKGLFEAANGGTLFLDEISEAPMRIQASLLRVLETKRIRRVGETNMKDVDVRIVAATNRSLKELSETDSFRRDLYYRLCAATLEIPSLAERMDDLPIMTKVFLNEACHAMGLSGKSIGENCMERLRRYNWPGNVREVRNLMEYFAATIPDAVIAPEHLPPHIYVRTGANVIPPSLMQGRTEPGFRKLQEEIEELEEARISEALAASGGVKVQAARLIQMPLRTMISKINKYGIATPAKPGATNGKGGN